MPEVVEIRRYVDFIKKHMLDIPITNLKILNGRYKKHGPFEGYTNIKKSLPVKIIHVNSKGKFLYITFDNGSVLFSTLGLSGGWTFNPKNTQEFKFPNLVEYLNEATVQEYHDKSLNHLNVQFETKRGSLYFFDTLSYGTMKVIQNIDELNKKLNKLGPDIMDINTDLNTFKMRLEKYKKKKIGLVLMNQKVISGIGNYLRADSLWVAKISPHRLIKNINDLEFKNLYDACRLLTWGDYNKKKAIKLGIIKENIKLPSDYKREFFVYYEEKDIYGNIIKKEPLYEGSQKRFIYWVPSRQK
jgi:formamidopyrimidine-DNA glycosylase